MEGPEKPESESQKARVSQKKQLQRLKLAEDERKLQTKRFVKQSVWKSKDGNHRLMMSGKSKDVSTISRGFFVFSGCFSTEHGIVILLFALQCGTLVM